LTASVHAASPQLVVPADTDPRTTDPQDPHYVWPPNGKPRGELLVFLPGTGAKPSNPRFQAFPELATELGYHAVSLSYPNNLASQKKCSRSPDPDAYVKFRLAIIQGGKIGPHKKIAEADSIESRLRKLLAYLAARQPDQGWGQFLDRKGGLKWGKIAFSGGSQGGGHAYIIGKYHKVARVIMFSSPKDYSFHFDAPAKGFDADTQTPLDRFYSLNHVRDDGNGCTYAQHQKILEQIGLTKLGEADAGKPQADYAGAHVLFFDPPISGKSKGRYHHSTLDVNVPPTKPAWKYMLTAGTD
jgi:hypothetical protein